MMWLGGRLPTKKRVFPRPNQTYTYQTTSNDNFQYVDYVQTLQKECKKMEQKGEACILVYDSKMMKNNEKLELQQIVNNLSNCYLVDYEDCTSELKQQDITYNTHTASQLNAWQEVNFDKNAQGKTTQFSFKESDYLKYLNTKIEVNAKEKQNKDNVLTRDSIGSLVDDMRILLLTHPCTLKKLAIEKNANNKKIKPDTNNPSLLYHDFDVISTTIHNKQSCNNKNKINQTITPQQPCLIFSKPYGNDATDASLYENVIIYAYSPNDRNIYAEDLMSYYLYYNTALSTKIAYMPLYYIIPPFPFSIYDFSTFYLNEGHRGWKIEDLQTAQTNTNNRQPTFELQTNFNICNCCDCNF